MSPATRRCAAPLREEAAAEILALHNGNALEALRTLIAERDAVEERLAVVSLILRCGQDAGLRP